MLRGASEVYEAAHEAAGSRARPGAVARTGCSPLHEEECLGVCDFAPVVQIDFANHDRVTPERMRELIAALRSGEVPEPSRGGPASKSFRRRVARARRAGGGRRDVSVAFERRAHARTGTTRA